MKAIHPAIPFMVIFALFLHFGCSTVESPSSNFRRFSDLLAQYPGTDKPLQIRKLTGLSFTSVFSESGSADVFIMVHPAYSLFFREANRSKYPEAKYKLLRNQFDGEALFMMKAARSGSVLVIIVPRDYAVESIAPRSYTSYLNTTASGRNVFYLYSESASNGSISANDMVELYHFLAGVKAGKVLVGGGYIGRCQEEFYKQVSSYLDKTTAYIVPEISTISPDDISEAEAGRILESIEIRNYSSVRNFISRKMNSVRFLSLPQK